MAFFCCCIFFMINFEWICAIFWTFLHLTLNWSVLAWNNSYEIILKNVHTLEFRETWIFIFTKSIFLASREFFQQWNVLIFSSDRHIRQKGCLLFVPTEHVLNRQNNTKIFCKSVNKYIWSAKFFPNLLADLIPIWL